MTTKRDRRWWRERWVADHYAELKSPELLAAHMKHKGHTPATLARTVAYERVKNGSDRGCSRQMISALLHGDSDQRKRRVRSCEPDLAAAIERVLDVPDHMLFSVLPKSRDRREISKSEAA